MLLLESKANTGMEFVSCHHCSCSHTDVESQLQSNNKAFVCVSACVHDVLMTMGIYSGGAKDGGGFRYWEDDFGFCGGSGGF